MNSDTSVVMQWRVEVSIADFIVGWKPHIPDGWEGNNDYLRRTATVPQRTLDEVCKEANAAFRARDMQFRVGNQHGKYTAGWERRLRMTYDEAGL